MKTSQTFVLALIIVASIFGTANAGLAYVWQINPAITEDFSLFILPDESGQPFTQAMVFNGQIVDANISLVLTAFNGSPVPYFPYQDIWLETESTTDSHCPDYVHFSPDSNTDINGQTSFTASLAGGGWSEGPVWIYLDGVRSAHPTAGEHPPIQMRFNSADIDGNGNIDLTDLTAFAADFYGEYQYRSDFHWDGVLDLADIVKMASGFGHNCQ